MNLRRIFFVATLTLLLDGFMQSLAIFLPSWLNGFLLPPIWLVICFHYFKPLEIFAVCWVAGAITDALGGFPIGCNMFLMVVFSFALGMLNVFKLKLTRKDFFINVLVFSFFYRLFSLATFWLFMPFAVNVTVMKLFLGPIFDGLLGLVIFGALGRILNLTSVAEHNDLVKNPF